MMLLALVVIALLLIISFGMAKWKSVVFSDIRNKLGDQVVFTNWKGRGVMRAYVVPANPNTLKQQAQRSKNKLMVAEYQTEVAPIGDAVTEYNTLALPRQISGFNIFGKYALAIKIASQSGGSQPYDNVITYTIPTDVSAMGMYRSLDGATVTEIVAKGALTSGADQTYDDDSLSVGDYEYFIGPADVFANLTGGNKDAVKCAHWKRNESTGVADPAVCAVV